MKIHKKAATYRSADETIQLLSREGGEAWVCAQLNQHGAVKAVMDEDDDHPWITLETWPCPSSPRFNRHYRLIRSPVSRSRVVSVVIEGAATRGPVTSDR